LWDVEERALLINVYLCFKKDNKYSWRLRISVVWRESLAFEYIFISFSSKQIWWLSKYISTSEIIWKKQTFKTGFSEHNSLLGLCIQNSQILLCSRKKGIKTVFEHCVHNKIQFEIVLFRKYNNIEIIFNLFKLLTSLWSSWLTGS
jgi:hypothetical protein